MFKHTNKDTFVHDIVPTLTLGTRVLMFNGIRGSKNMRSSLAAAIHRNNTLNSIRNLHKSQFRRTRTRMYVVMAYKLRGST